MCKSLKEYINRLSTHNEVLGILEFGGRFINDEKNDYSDYDMVVFTSHNLNSVTGVHFYLGTIPVDCMFISYTDEMDEQTLKKKNIFFRIVELFIKKMIFLVIKNTCLKVSTIKKRLQIELYQRHDIQLVIRCIRLKQD